MNRGPTLVEMSWLIAVFAAGVIGLVAMVFPLFGFLGYWGAFAFPFVFLAELAFAFVAAIMRGRWRRGYVFANLGMAVDSLAIFIVAAIAVAARPGFQPDPAQWAPAYFGVVLMGLAAGITVAMLLPGTQVQR